ncbi:MAG: hypothetical protein ABW128_06750 [Rhizorhabdus sp.]
MPEVGSEIKSGFQINGERGAVVDATEVRGGWYPVADMAARDAIPLPLRRNGMRVQVADAGDGNARGFLLSKNDAQPNDAGFWTTLARESELRDRATHTGKMPFAGVTGVETPAGLLQVLSGDLGPMALAFLDALGYLGVGLGIDGTLSASKIRSLASIITPLLTLPALGKIAVGADGEINFPAKGKITTPGGINVEIRETNYDASISDANGNVLAGIKDGKIYGVGGAVTSVSSRRKIQQTFPNGVVIENHAHNYDWCICDTNGYVLIGWSGGKLYGLKWVAQAFAAPQRLVITMANGIVFEFTPLNYDIVVADTAGNALVGWMQGAYYGPTPAVTGTTIDLDAMDASNRAYSASVYQRRVSNVQLPTAAYNIFYMYGQSLAQGDETWPALSRVAIAGTLMLGGNTMGSTDTAVFTQFTPTGFQPLKAMTVNGATTWPDETVTQASGGARGEPANIGWTRGARSYLNSELLVDVDTSRQLVTINVAKSGATIGELRKSHTEGTVEYYNKYTGSLTQALAAAGGSSLVVAGITYMQGEFDYYVSARNSTNVTYPLYKAELIQLVADMQADAIVMTGQSKPPAMILYQTGASYTRDVDANNVPGMHVGMAQLDFALESDKAWMFGPIYPYTDKGGHLDSNGSRWCGHQIAKVWRQVVLDGRDWEPLRPIKITKDGTSVIYVSYHVPFAPLVFDEPQLASGNEYANASKGFRLTDDAGAVPISNVEIVRGTIIKITCGRALSTNPKVWYASQGTTGNGMVRDSDPTVASDNYVYEPDRGMYTTANIAQFVNKPYYLWNWSVGFFLPVGYQE